MRSLFEYLSRYIIVAKGLVVVVGGDGGGVESAGRTENVGYRYDISLHKQQAIATSTPKAQTLLKRRH